MNKSQRRADAIRETKKLNAAHLALNTIIMYGLAGSGKGVEHAMLCATMINQFSINKVITMNLRVFGGTDLELMINRGEFSLAPPGSHCREAEMTVPIIR